ncbi:hypothetical protein XF35_19870 [Streptomyces platensis subsp. clarensis]|nr:hypothetical protein [Streptomyces platensis subsp. clarensis]
MCLASFRRRDWALAVIALASRGSMSLLRARPRRGFFLPPEALLRRVHPQAPTEARASSTAMGVMRVPISRAVWSRSGHSCSGCSRAPVGW